MTNQPTPSELPTEERRESIARCLDNYAKSFAPLHRDIADDFRGAAQIIRSTLKAREPAVSEIGRLREALTVVVHSETLQIAKMEARAALTTSKGAGG